LSQDKDLAWVAQKLQTKFSFKINAKEMKVKVLYKEYSGRNFFQAQGENAKARCPGVSARK
jgi:hypothetical protein